MVLCGLVPDGDLFTEGQTLIQNTGEQPLSITGVDLLGADGVELVGVHAYDPAGAGFITYGFLPGTLEDVGVPAEAGVQRITEFEPYTVDSGAERALLLESRLTGESGRVERVRVRYKAGDSDFVHDGGITIEAERSDCR